MSTKLEKNIRAYNKTREYVNSLGYELGSRVGNNRNIVLSRELDVNGNKKIIGHITIGDFSSLKVKSDSIHTLIFEGAGWKDADVSKATDVGNCRIRTTLRNCDGRVIYLEMLLAHYNKKDKIKPEWAKEYEYVACIDAVFMMTQIGIKREIFLGN